MTFSLTQNFFSNARGLTLTDSATVTWAFNKSTNSITATATGVGGGLTSVGLADTSGTPIYTISNSPLVANGTIDMTLGTQTQKTFLAGPTSGVAAQPTFRVIAAADVPTLNQNTSGSSGSCTGNAATATSATSATSATTATTATNIAGGANGSLPYQTGAGATSLLAAGSTGSLLTIAAGIPAWEAVPTWNQNTSGTAAGLSATLVIGSGGTGQTTAAAAFNALAPMTTTGDMVYDSSAATAARLAIGATGSILAVAGGVPAWTAAVFVDAAGTIYWLQPTPTAVNATATLTIAQLLTRIITSTTAAAVTATLPTGTLSDAGVLGGASPNNTAFEWSVINTGAANAFTVAAGTAHTLVGSGVVALSTSAMFLTRKTAANTFVTYRLAV